MRASIHQQESQDSQKLAQTESRVFKTPIRDLIVTESNRNDSPLTQLSGIKSGKKSLQSAQKKQL